MFMIFNKFKNDLNIDIEVLYHNGIQRHAVYSLKKIFRLGFMCLL